MKTNLQNFNIDILNSWLDKGLCKGAGDGENSVCLEQAIALCAGIPLTDKPDSCVSPALSAFGRRLNDSRWSSDTARSEGVREFAYIQLGTAGIIDEKKWAKRVAELTIRQIVPKALRAAAKMNPKHAESLEAAALGCEIEGTRAAALIGKNAAYAAADAADAAYAAADAADAAYADADAAYAAAYAAAAYADTDAAYADAAAAAAAYAAYAAYAAAAYADTDAAYAAARDEILTLSASIAVQATLEQIND